MASFTIEAGEPLKLGGYGRGNVTIQNLGPGEVYLGTDDEVSIDNGFVIAVQGVYETPREASRDLYVSASEDTEIRVFSI